jgi:hypothetical protein
MAGQVEAVVFRLLDDVGHRETVGDCRQSGHLVGDLVTVVFDYRDVTRPAKFFGSLRSKSQVSLASKATVEDRQ